MPSQTTRRELLRRGIAAGGLGVGGGLVFPPAAAVATARAAPAPPPDVVVIGRLLRLELLVLYVYQHVLGTSLLSPSARGVVDGLRDQEQAHVDALSAALSRLGGTAPAAPANLARADKDLAHRNVAGRVGQLRGGRDALRLLLAIEHVAEGAYYVSMSELGDPTLLRLGAEIMASEAQHATVLTVLLHPGALTQAVPYAFVQGRR
jgi:Ferritin-like domain